MLKNLLISFLIIISISSKAKVIFPMGDSTLALKENLINEMNTLMGDHSAVLKVQKSSKLLLWTNEAKVLERKVDDLLIYEQTTLPLFVPAIESNMAYLRVLIKEQCQCNIDGFKIAGVMIAHPLVAAKMFF